MDQFCARVGKSRDQVCVIVIREEGTSRNFSDQKRVEIILQKSLDYQVDIHRAPFSWFNFGLLNITSGLPLGDAREHSVR